MMLTCEYSFFNDLNHLHSGFMNECLEIVEINAANQFYPLVSLCGCVASSTKKNTNKKSETFYFALIIEQQFPWAAYNIDPRVFRRKPVLRHKNNKKLRM